MYVCLNSLKENCPGGQADKSDKNYITFGTNKISLYGCLRHLNTRSVCVCVLEKQLQIISSLMYNTSAVHSRALPVV